MRHPKNIVLGLRKQISTKLFDAGLIRLGYAIAPKIQGGTNWGGSWSLGAGYTFASASAPAYTFADPKYIRITEQSTFTKFLATLAGGTQLFGKRSAYPTIELGIADDSSVANLAADPAVSSACTLTPPSGTTRNITARCVSDELGQIEPQGEFVRIIKFQGSTVWS